MHGLYDTYSHVAPGIWTFSVFKVSNSLRSDYASPYKMETNPQGQTPWRFARVLDVDHR